MKIDGIPVEDAKHAITFEVTKRDVARGDIKDPDSCAMALACMRYQRAKAAKIHLFYSYVLEKDHWLRYKTPVSVSREIVAFDRGGSFEPGEYTLRPPAKSDRLGSKIRHAHRTITGKRRSKLKIHITANVRTRPVFASRVIDE